MQVLKTVKMYVGGAFIRSESGTTVPFVGHDGSEFARICMASRKDFRNAVVAGKSGAVAWSKKSAYNRSQILYRMGEMAQGKSEELCSLLKVIGRTPAEAKKEVQVAIDTFVYYAGWCDKYQQIAGALNPVVGPFHNFTSPVSMGLVAHIDSNKFDLQKLVDNICSILVGGNSVISIVSLECAPIVTTLGEVFATSDLPGGVVNLLCGDIDSLSKHIATHMEVKAISFQNEDEKLYHAMRSDSIDNMKRVIPYTTKRESVDLVLSFVESKTVWHPIGY